MWASWGKERAGNSDLDAVSLTQPTKFASDFPNWVHVGLFPTAGGIFKANNDVFISVMKQRKRSKVKKLKANGKREEGWGGGEWRAGESKSCAGQGGHSWSYRCSSVRGSWRWPRLWKGRWFITQTINQQVWPSLHSAHTPNCLSCHLRYPLCGTMDSR